VSYKNSILSAAIVAPAMLLLLIVINEEVPRVSGIQSHNFHIKSVKIGQLIQMSKAERYKNMMKSSASFFNIGRS
jgi:hypothetical protein